MSTKSAKKFKLPFGKKAAEPRSLPDIQTEYSQLCNRAGAAQYQVHVYNQELERLNKRMVEVNQEASERNRLDAEKQAAEAPKKDEASSGS